MCAVAAAGEILVNGLPKQQATWARQIGYVEQMVRHEGLAWRQGSKDHAGNHLHFMCAVSV
jgi:hypothetical protein